MKEELSVWSLVFNVAVALVGALFALWKGRQANQQTLIDNAERWERLAENREKENVILRDRMKRDEAALARLEERYNRLMRRYVEIEDYMREVQDYCERREITLPKRGDGGG